MTISNLGPVSTTQPSWLARKQDPQTAADPAPRAGGHHHGKPGGAGQPTLSDSLQSLLLGAQSGQATTAPPGSLTPAATTAQQGTTHSKTTQSVLQQLQQSMNQALTAYDATSQSG